VILEMLDRYAAGEWRAADLSRRPDAAALVTALEKRGSAWISKDTSPEGERRLAAAAFALEAADSLLASPVRVLARRLFSWGCERIRDAPRPTRSGGQDWALEWHLAAVSLLLKDGDANMLLGDGISEYVLAGRTVRQPGDGKSDLRTGHIRHALSAFPQHPRLRLAEALAHAGVVVAFHTRILKETTAVTQSFVRGTTFRPPSLVSAADRLAPLTEHPETRAEANAHLAYLHLLSGDLAQAEKHAEAASQAANDPHAAYLGRMIAGTIAEEEGRHQDAVANYRLALTLHPNAHSATVRLVAALLDAGHPDEAAELSQTLLTRQGDHGDPWRSQWTGGGRFLAQDLDALRAQVKGDAR
jgi:tetratricopeptide (TPR) repeat protein